ncbi:MAG: glycoside hydrolase family 15 protein [Terriglobia bacterium]
MTLINSQQIKAMIRPGYSLEEIRTLSAFLERMGTFAFASLPNGLFPAAVLDSDESYTAYSDVWVRDNIHIAHAHYAVGRASTATKTVRALMQYFVKHRRRFVDIIEGRSDPAIAMNRPHIRFDGRTLEEVKGKWAHAQNDALGYFLWLFSKLVNEGNLSPAQDELDTLALFPLYFRAIRYWEDEDSGHWEETRKVSASSIGVVIAGLHEFGKLISITQQVCKHNETAITAEFVESLIKRGEEALGSILPAECVQADPSKHRLYDCALLFLIYPLKVLKGQKADTVLGNVSAHLQGEFGVRRYLGDSYWAPDYKNKLSPEQRTADCSDDLSRRDRLLPALGQEAQWCIFDPIISCVYGMRFRATRLEGTLTKQTEYLNRSLGQITPEGCQQAPPFRCPELYYLEHGRYVPNDHVPLLWTQANLMLSLKLMEESCILAAGPRQVGGM